MSLPQYGTIGGGIRTRRFVVVSPYANAAMAIQWVARAGASTLAAPASGTLKVDRVSNKSWTAAKSFGGFERSLVVDRVLEQSLTVADYVEVHVVHPSGV